MQKRTPKECQLFRGYCLLFINKQDCTNTALRYNSLLLVGTTAFTTLLHFHLSFVFLYSAVAKDFVNLWVWLNVS